MMMKNHLSVRRSLAGVRVLPAMLFALGLSACGGGSEALIIPLFEFGFSGSSGATQIQVFFLPDAPATSSGNFDGVNMNVDAVQFAYTGTYSGCTFSISTNAAVTVPAAASYSGRFISNDRIELTPTSGNGLPVLTLQRQGVGTRQMGC